MTEFNAYLHAITALGASTDEDSAFKRFMVLSECLSSRLLQVREAAVSGFQLLDDPQAAPLLAIAYRFEILPSLRTSMQGLIANLKQKPEKDKP